jgi:O-acetyl-ADP-ribose deacetylase (regulator of RNase III)
MTLTEVRGNVFEARGDVYFAHCIAADLRMGAGIAVQFQKKFGLRNSLQGMEDPVHGPTCILVNSVFNLITKKRSNGKPTRDTIRQALRSMAGLLKLMTKDARVRVAMPRIGCGLDRQSWAVVREIIREEFAGIAVDVVVYKL